MTSSSRLSVVTICVTVLATVSIAFSQGERRTPEHAKTATYPPVAFSHDDLFGMVSRIKRFVASANAAHNNQYATEKLSLSDGTTTVTIDLLDQFRKDDLAAAPSPSTSVKYLYYGTRGAPLKIVSLTLSDYDRMLQVEGSSLEQIDGLVGLIANDLERQRAYFGLSSSTRIGLGALLLVLIAVISATSQTVSTRWRTTIMVSTFGLLITFWVIPWDRALAGMVVYSDSASFAVRNAAMITLVGTVVGVVGLLIVLVQFTVRGSSSPQSGSS